MLNHNPFYHRTIRKIIAGFGTLFNDIKIERRNYLTNNVEQTIKVPLSYKSKQFWFTRLQQDPFTGSEKENPTAITLPRMGYIMENMEYDARRAVSPAGRVFSLNIDDNTVLKSIMSPSPWNFDFTLNIITKHLEDGFTILEQILPNFNPWHSISMNEIEGFDIIRDIPILYLSTNMEEITPTVDNSGYFIWDIRFKVMGYLYKPVGDVKIIRRIEERTVIENGNDIISQVVTPLPLEAFPNEPISTTVQIVSDTIPEESINTNIFNLPLFNETLFNE